VLLEEISEWLVHVLQLLQLLLLDVTVIKDIDVVLSNGLYLSLFVLGQVLGCELVDWVGQQEHFVAFAGVLLENWRFEDLRFAVTG